MARTDPFCERKEYFLSCPDETGALTALPVLLLSAAAARIVPCCPVGRPARTECCEDGNHPGRILT